MRLALSFCFPQVGVAVDDIAIVYRHDLVATYSDCGLFHNCPSKILDNCSVFVSRVQRDGKCEASCSRNNHILIAEVGKADQELLILVDGRRIVGYNHALSDAFDPEWFSQASKRIQFASIL